MRRMTIYVDADFKCHISNPEGVLTAVETDVFNGKCQTYIEGYRFVPSGQTWTRSDGATFSGEMIAPWKDWQKLNDAQQKCVQEQRIAELEAQNETLTQCLLEMSEVVYA